MSALILVVDDEEDLLSTLEYNLEREGYQVRTATNGESALSRAAEEPVPNLILLDLMLPDMPGTEVCRKLRQQEATRNIPVIMITAKAEEIDRVVGFEVGADDYVTKPFSTRELLLRVRAVLRRAVPQGSEEITDATSEVTFGRLRIDASAHRVWVDNSEITLTALEFKLLNFFLGRKGRVQTRDTLLNDVWGIQADVATRTVDTHVKRLRQKLGDAGTYIETLRGVGYRFRPQPDEASPAM
ncbi:MAG: response regulator transcription factor [Myxococcales bacterium]|nr:response regulator transcription factor [Myxococcales bacterium]